MHPDAELLRHQLRRDARAHRRALSETERDEASAGIALQLQSLAEFASAQQLGAYAAVSSELSLATVIADALQRGQLVYLPHLEHTAPHLRFAPWSGQRRMLLPNRFGIPEPLVDVNALLPAESLDVVLLPLVAFDRHGGRLGSGAGYYDRALAFRQSERRPPWLIGVGFACQEVAAIPMASWDVPLDFVATEREIFATKPL